MHNIGDLSLSGKKSLYCIHFNSNLNPPTKLLSMTNEYKSNLYGL